MKYTILIFIALVSFSCSDDETSYSVTPELSTYVDAFYSEGAARGVNLPKTNLVAELKSSCQSSIQIIKDDEQWVLSFDK